MARGSPGRPVLLLGAWGKVRPEEEMSIPWGIR